MNKRDIINAEMVELSKRYNDLLIEHATAYGKTKSALEISKITGNKHIIIHWETSHKQNLIDEILKHGFNLKDFTFCTYAGISKLKNATCDTLILDECHHLTKRSASIVWTIKRKKTVYLSAEVPFAKRQNILKLLSPTLYTSKKTIKDGVEEGVIPKPTIQTHYINLNDSIINNEYIRCLGEKRISKEVTVEQYMIENEENNWGVEYKVRCTQKEYYDLIQFEINKIKLQIEKLTEAYNLTSDVTYKHTISKLEVVLKRLGLERKEFLANAKLDYAKRLFNRIKGKKIIFTNSIDNSNEFKGTQVNSSNTGKVNRVRVEEFKEGIINNLVVVDMLKESHNIPNLKHAIIHQLSMNNLLDFIQIQGRTLRSKNSKLHIIVVSNTVDEDTLEKLKAYNLIYDNNNDFTFFG